MLKKLYNKCIEWSSHKSANSILGFVAFIESFIFPIPPDVLIIPMTIAKIKNWFRIAMIATIGSVLGACIGYLIGYIFFKQIGVPIFEMYGIDNTIFLKDKVDEGGGIIAWASILSIAAFTPIPFKLVTIISGFLHFNIIYFIIISFLARGSRFFLITILIGKFGPKIMPFIKKKII